MPDSQRPDERPVEATQGFDAESVAAELVQVLDQYMADLKAGTAPDREALLSQHPHLASQLDACLAGIEFIHSTGAGEQPAQPQLGDFRIIREIGRGGMGAVYEAEQVSLGRRVALKVLRFGAVSDPQAVERFQREAETVAKLHHTNIVPIFSVGSENGVNYYAMQFIEGRSLADVARDRERPVDADTIAEWGLQAAEALAHAHQRQVIHRDVKPSNLLLDNDGCIWLTDFGLAKRLDDVTLSMTGALLGTPRYMSPEQASAAAGRVDHRTDIYSLGATLYELATGKPVFAADAPHAVISQIINDEPEPPRKLRPELSRDLETILMKCLDKDPAQRYSSAQELVDDLRAFLDGRPIAARRENPVQLGVKWVRRHKPAVTVGAATVAATLLLVLGIWFGSRWWTQWHSASVAFSSNAPPLVVEVQDPSGSQVAPPVTVPTQQAIQVPSGDVLLKASASGRFPQVYQARLAKDGDTKLDIDVIDQVVTDLGPVMAYGVVEFPDGADCFLTTETGIRRVDAETGNVLWDVDLLSESNHPEAAKLGRFIRSFDDYPAARRGKDSWNVSPGFFPQAIDLDGDEHLDVVCYLRHEAILLALSGKDGRVLWRVTDEDYTDRPRAANANHGTVIGRPLIVDDLDDDGTRDLVATLVMDINTDTEQHPGRHNRGVRRWLDVISGRSGQTIWRHYLDDKLFVLPKGKEPPYAFRWYCDDSFYAKVGDNRMTVVKRDRLIRWFRPWAQRDGQYTYVPSPAHVIDMGGASQVIVVAGQSVVSFDLKTGQPGETTELDFRPAAPIRWEDLDGDGVDDLITLEQLSFPPPPPGRSPLAPPPKIRMAVWSLPAKEMLWQRELKAYLPHQPQADMKAPDWPLVVDLNHDGRREMLFPHGTSALPAGGQTMRVLVDLPWGEIQAADALTGEPLWTARVPNMDEHLDRFVTGPDINGDGYDEVFVGGLFALEHKPFYVYVDCLSGKDGTTLWRSRHPLHQAHHWSFGVAGMTWRRAGGVLPKLVVQVTPEAGHTRNHAATIVFDPLRGDVLSAAIDIVNVQPADVDADGVHELVSQWVTAESKSNHENLNLSVLSGTRGERWRQLGGPQYWPAGDFDGDGIRDLIAPAGQSTISVSGATGRTLWKSGNFQFQFPHEYLHNVDAMARHSGDLNGDGSDDQLVFSLRQHLSHGKRSPLRAVSGRDGRTLWEADIRIYTVAQIVTADIRDLDGDGRPEVVFAAAMDLGYGDRKPHPTDYVEGGQLWIVVLSGQSGRVQWKTPLSAAYGADLPTGRSIHSFRDVRFELQFADLNGDGQLDFVVPGERSDVRGELELRALSGADGQLLWRRPVPADGHPQSRLRNFTSVVLDDINDDGRTEVVAVEFAAAASREMRVVGLDGAGGNQLWNWTMPTSDRWGRRVNTSHLMSVRLRPFVIRASKGRRYVCVQAYRATTQHALLAVLDGRGQLVHEVECGVRESLYDFHAWPCDVDGDERDEIVVYEKGGAFRVVRPSDDWATVWSGEREGVRISDVLDVVDARDGQAGAIVLRQQTADVTSIVALDANTGRDRWICYGPRTGYLGPLKFERQLLLNTGHEQTAPHAAFMYNRVATCRRAAFLGDSAPPVERKDTAHLADLRFDPRFYRPLPWMYLKAEFYTRLRFLSWAGFFSISLIIVPVGLIGWMAWRRRFNLRVLLTLPAIVLLFMFAWQVEPAGYEFDQLGERFGAATAMVPVVLCAGILIRWIVLRKFDRLGLWLLVLIGCTIAAAILAFLDGPRHLSQGERLLWDGWYLVLYPGLYLTACVTVGGLLLWHLGRRIISKALKLFSGKPNPSAPPS